MIAISQNKNQIGLQRSWIQRQQFFTNWKGTAWWASNGFQGPGKGSSSPRVEFGEPGFDLLPEEAISTSTRTLLASLGMAGCYLSDYTIAIHTHTHTLLTALFPGLPMWAGTRQVKPIWILLKQETVSGSGISWAICKSAPCSRQTTTPAPHHSVFTGRMPFLPPN